LIKSRLAQFLKYVEDVRVAKKRDPFAALMSVAQDQQRVVEAAVVELRGSAEGFGDEAVSDFELFEDGKVQGHRLVRGEFL
jgi:hypothetical protein